MVCPDKFKPGELDKVVYVATSQLAEDTNKGGTRGQLLFLMSICGWTEEDIIDSVAEMASLRSDLETALRKKIELLEELIEAQSNLIDWYEDDHGTNNCDCEDLPSDMLELMRDVDSAGEKIDSQHEELSEEDDNL